MALITYTDKATMNENTSIPAINKVQASDMNEIKSVVNENYDDLVNKTQAPITTDGDAVKCGYQIDGKDVYVKRISFGDLPNASAKSVATGIDFSTHTLIKIEGIGKYQGNNIALPLPFSHPTRLDFNIMVNIDASNNLVVTTGIDRSANKGYFNIYYI